MNNPHSQQRSQFSRALIRQAFTSLLQQKPIQRISVRELCQKAGVNRSTFYAHYQDIYDLLEKLEAEMAEDFQRALAPLLNTQEECLSPLQITTGIYQCLKENADVCTVTLGENGDKDFALRLLSIGRESCLRAYSRQFPGATRQQLEYFYAFASGGTWVFCANGPRRAWPPPPRKWPKWLSASCSTAWSFCRGSPCLKASGTAPRRFSLQIKKGRTV